MFPRFGMLINFIAHEMINTRMKTYAVQILSFAYNLYKSSIGKTKSPIMSHILRCTL